MYRKLEDPQDRERERAGIETAASWPRWPYLPVKRVPLDSGMPECAIVCSFQRNEAFYLHPDTENPGAVRVHLVNLFDADEKSLENVDVLDYEDIDAFFDDGWIVD